MTTSMTVPLGDVLVDASPGFASGEDLDEGIFQIRMNNISRRGELLLDERRRVPPNHQVHSTLLEPGDVLFNATNSPDLVGKTAFFAGCDEPAVYSNHFIRLRTDGDRLDPRFLTRWLQREFERGYFKAKSKQWVNQATFGKDRLLDLPIPLPPIEGQRRIAEVFDAADALRAKRQEALAKLDTLTRAIFIEMFGGAERAPVNPAPSDAVHPDGWRWIPLLGVAELATGHTPDRAVPEYWNGDISWLNLNEIRRFDGKWCSETNAKTTAAGVANSSAVILPRGTVCFSRTASIGFVTVMATPMTTSQDFVNWVCSEALNPFYLMHALIMSRPTLRASSSGSTHKTIYVRDAKRFSVLLPPRPLQDLFVEKLDRCSEAESAMFEGLAEMSSLYASLQQRAFRGEL